MNDWVKRGIVGIVFVLMFIAVRVTPLGDIITFENFVRYRQWLRDYVLHHYWASVGAYIGAYIIAVLPSVPASAVVMTIAGGFLFGPWGALVYINIGATLGATGAFLITRYVIGDWIQHQYRKKLKRFNQEVERNGVYYFLLVRLVPAFPFFLVHTLAALTKISLINFIWTTSLGIIPGSLVYAYAGSRLNYIDTPRDILSPRIFLALGALSLLALLPVVIKKIRRVMAR